MIVGSNFNYLELNDLILSPGPLKVCALGRTLASSNTAEDLHKPASKLNIDFFFGLVS